MYGGVVTAEGELSPKSLVPFSPDFKVDVWDIDRLTRNNSDLSNCPSSVLGALNKSMIACHLPILTSIISLGVGKRAGKCTAAISGIEAVVKGEYSKAPLKLPLSKEAATSIATLWRGTYGTRHFSMYMLSVWIAFTLDVMAS